MIIQRHREANYSRSHSSLVEEPRLEPRHQDLIPFDHNDPSYPLFFKCFMFILGTKSSCCFGILEFMVLARYQPCPTTQPSQTCVGSRETPTEMVSEKQPLHVCIGVYVHVYVRATMCVHVEPRVGHQEPLSIALCGVALRQGFSMNTQLSILARQANWPESSHDSPFSVIGC